MKYLDVYYSINIIVIAISITFLSLRKITVAEPHHRQVLIIGCNFESAVVAYYLKLGSPNVNVTVVEEAECAKDDIFRFISGNSQLIAMLKQIKYKYEQVHEIEAFWNGQQLISQNQNTYKEIYLYGLSQYALKYVLTQFQGKLDRIQNKIFKSFDHLFQYLDEQINASPVNYLIYEVGLDRQYVKSIVLSYIYGNMMQQLDINILAIKLKLLELFETKYQIVGGEADLIKRLYQETPIYEQQLIKEIKNNSQNGFNISTSNYTFLADQIIYCNKSFDAKQYYYHTVVEGVLNPQYYKTTKLPSTIYSTDNIGKIQKLCLLRCRKQKQNLYVIQSKSKIFDKDLKMFLSVDIIKSTKNKIPRYTPTQSRHFQEHNLFYLNSVSTLTDSKQFAVIVAKNIANLIHAN